MKHTAAAVLALSWFISGAQGQVAEGGVSRAKPEYCSQVEPIHPNFTPAEDVRVRGRITDQTTAPFQNSPIELRRFISERKQVTVKKVSTDADGKFDLGLVETRRLPIIVVSTPWVQTAGETGMLRRPETVPSPRS